MNRIVVAGAAAAGLITGIALFSLTRPGDDRTAPRPAEAASAGTPAVASAPGDAPPGRAERTPAAPRVPAAARGGARDPAAVEAPAEMGTLRIDTDVPGAQVFVDRRFIGSSPATVEHLTPGTHRINVSAPGFDGVAQTIDVEPGPRDLTIRLREVRLDATLAVVHKHRLGSCTGQLVATPDGIRYETANAEDRFSSPLGDLDAFQVDYDDRNLRVRLRGGREYNFTEPEGNADRLFVFHRDVQRARERLAKAEAR